MLQVVPVSAHQHETVFAFWPPQNQIPATERIQLVLKYRSEDGGEFRLLNADNTQLTSDFCCPAGQASCRSTTILCISASLVSAGSLSAGTSATDQHGWQILPLPT